MKKRIYKLRNSIIISLIVMATTIASSYFLFSQALTFIENDIEDYLLGIAHIAAKQVDGNTHNNFTSREQENSSEYLKEIKKLSELKSHFGDIKYIYTCIIKDGDVYFILDPTPEEAKTPDGVEEKSHIMDKYDEASEIPELIKSLKEHNFGIVKKPYTDRWGTFVSAYAPIFNDKNQFVGVVGVDINAKKYADRIKGIKNAEIICITLSFITSFLIGFIVWRQTGNLNSRTLELEKANKELLDAKKTAEAATLSKTSFLANMSHEIRTPMNGVLGIAGLMLDTHLNDKQKELVDIIIKSGDSLLEIVNDILDVSKIEAGELTLEPINFSLRTIIDDTVGLLSVKAMEQKTSLSTEFSGGLHDYYFGDSVRIKQIMMNLLSNSIKFTKNGNITVRVREEKIDHDNARLFFEVEDNGIGIPEDKLDYIFNKFTQAEESTTRKFGGTGLGLAICKSLTRMMDGSIGVRSTLGKGSTFYFDLVIAYGKEEEITTEIERDKITILYKARALVVDDVRLNLMMLERILQKYGCYVDQASNGLEAVSMVKQFNYDIVFMDCHMPEMDGYEATRKIRKYQSENNQKHIPIIAVTADAMKGNEQKCLAAGMNGYLNKPVKEYQIENMLRKWLIEDYSALNGKNILVAEDDSVNQMIIETILKEFMCNVEIAEDGLTALKKSKSKIYDAILIDFNLPKMSGREVIEHICQNDSTNSKTPIIAFTAASQEEIMEEMLSNKNIDDFIAKPVNKENVYKILRKWVV